MGRIRQRLIRNRWITRSKPISAFLAKIVKDWSPDIVKKVILDLESEKFSVYEVNDILARRTLCIIIVRSKEYKEAEKPKQTKQAEQLIKDLVKDVLND